MFRSARAAWLCVCVISVSEPVSAQQAQTIFFDAANSNTIVSENRTVFYRLRITQGNMRIEAEKGITQAGTDFSESSWEFEGNVEIDIENAEIRADAADLKFINYELVRAEVEGEPASFSDVNAETGERTEGQAERFVYNLSDQVIRFEDSTSIRDSRNSVTGRLLKYDLVNQNIVFEGDEQSGERVRITIQPPPDAQDPEALDEATDRAREQVREAAEAAEAERDDRP